MRPRPAPRAPRSSSVVVTIDRHPAYPGVRSVTLRSDAGQVGQRLLETVAAPEALVGVAVDEQELLRAPERYAGFARRLTVVVERDRAMGLVREAATLRRLGAFVELAPAALGDGGVLMMLASLGVPVGVGLAPVLDAARLEPITRYFLRSPTLESPIEPLHLVATALGGDGRRGPTITGFYRTIPGRHLHVTAERRVSLSRALAAQGLFLGDLDGGEESWRGSPPPGRRPRR